MYCIGYHIVRKFANLISQQLQDSRAVLENNMHVISNWWTLTPLHPVDILPVLWLSVSGLFQRVMLEQFYSPHASEGN